VTQIRRSRQLTRRRDLIHSAWTASTKKAAKKSGRCVSAVSSASRSPNETRSKAGAGTPNPR
jgi:hypothetical protein